GASGGPEFARRSGPCRRGSPATWPRSDSDRYQDRCARHDDRCPRLPAPSRRLLLHPPLDELGTAAIGGKVHEPDVAVRGMGIDVLSQAPDDGHVVGRAQHVMSKLEGTWIVLAVQLP